MPKAPTIVAGAASGNDTYSANEEQAAAGTLYFNVLTNDAKKTVLYSLDDGQPIDLLSPDGVLAPNQSNLGASIWITADGRVGYALDSARAQSLAAGETFQDSFIYAVQLANGSLVWQSVQVTITGTNDGPVAVADLASVAEDVLATGSVAGNDSDVDHGAVLKFATSGALPAGFAMTDNGSWVLDASNPSYQSLGVGQSTQVSVAYTVTDEHGASSGSTLTLTITGTNDAPLVSGPVSGTASEDGAQVVLDTLAKASDVDGNATLTVVNVPPAQGMPAGVTYDVSSHSFTLDPTNAAFQALALGETSTVTVNYGVSDGTATTAASVSWLVIGANDSPVATSTAAEVAEDNTVSGQLFALDPDHGAQVGFALNGDAPAGFAVSADGSWTFDARDNAYQHLGAGESMIVQVPFTATDEHGATASSFLTIAVTGTNDAPALTGAPAQLPNATEDSGFTVTADQLLAGWSDPDGDELSVTNLTLDHATAVDNGDGSFAILPDGNFNGTLQLSYDVSDGSAVSATSVALTVDPVNDPATNFTGDLSGAVTEDAAATSAMGNVDFTDPDNPNDSWLAVSSPIAGDHGYGTFTVSAAGAWQYQLNNGNSSVNALQTGQSLVDTFSLTTADGTTTQVSVTINGHTDYVYVTPPVSSAADPNDFDLLHADQTRTSTQFSFTGTAASEVIEGSNGNDVMRGQGGADVIYGHGGNDRLLGELDIGSQPPPDGIAGNDIIYGQAGNDYLAGGLGSDTLYGGSGADELNANNSLGSNPETVTNTLYGGSGNDRLYGDAGDDVLVGGTGADWLTGGAGADRFVLTSAADTGDLAFDFQSGVDKLDLSALGLNSADFIGALASPGMVGPGQVGFMTVMGGSQLDTIVYIDTDGVFGSDLEIKLVGTVTFGSSDVLWT